MAAGATNADAALSWTNLHQVKMRGYLEVTAGKANAARQTSFIIEGYQAPAVGFEWLVPTFAKMLETFAAQ